MKKWQRIIRFIAQMAVFSLIIKALQGPVRWNHPQDGASQ